MAIHLNNKLPMPQPRPNLDNPFIPEKPSTISDADALSALLGPEDAADARRLLGDKKELPDPEANEFVLSDEEQVVADAEQVEAEKSLEQRRKDEYFAWAKEQLGKDEGWVEDTFTFHEDGTISVEGNLGLDETDIKSFPEGLTEITGNLSLTGCTSLTSLEHIPQTIRGNLSLRGCTSLTSLKHIPQTIKGNLSLARCTSLKSLEHIPQTIRGNLSFRGCTSLTSLEHIPQTIKGSLFLTDCTSLTSLEHIPQTIGYSLWISGCTSLTSLEHLSGVHIKGGLYMRRITLDLPKGVTVDGDTHK